MKKNLYILGLVAALALASPAFSQTLTFTASTTTGAGSVTTTLTWSTTPSASSCTAAGHASWTGSKAASGTQTLPALTNSGTYNLTMDCTWPGNTSATINWIAPTQNTDGSALAKCATAQSTGTCLAGYHVFRRLNTQDMTGAEMTPVEDPQATSKSFTNLVPGTHWFTLEAVNGNGTPSDLATPYVSKVISASQTVNRSVTITVNPKPASPTGLAVQ